MESFKAWLYENSYFCIRTFSIIKLSLCSSAWNLNLNIPDFRFSHRKMSTSDALQSEAVVVAVEELNKIEMWRCVNVAFHFPSIYLFICLLFTRLFTQLVILLNYLQFYYLLALDFCWLSIDPVPVFSSQGWVALVLP